MDNGVILQLAAENPDMSDVDRLVNLYHLLSQVLVFDVPGDVVELGCNAGRTSVFLRMVMDHFAPDRELHVYDSFQGLPSRGPHDEYLDEGDCQATVEQLEQVFQRWGVRPPVVHPGWFQQTLPQRLPERIAFAYLDGDFYDSILLSLEAVYARLAPRAIVVVDDYCDRDRNPLAWPGLPGVKRACDDFSADRPERFSVLVGTGDLAMAYVRKA